MNPNQNPLLLILLFHLFRPATAGDSPHHLRRAILGILLGSVTGLLTSILLLLVLRRVLLFATPLPLSPVLFSPKPLSSLSSLSLPSPPLPPRRLHHTLSLLARLRHPNVLPLQAYSSGINGLTLFYDRVDGGTLEEMKDGGFRWPERHRVAVGVVRALRYLHFECRPRVLHCDLRPRNVVVGVGFEVRLAECGVRGLVAGRQGDSCYIAPECLQSCRYTEKSDIFSFGVLLAMLLTGRDPSSFAGESGSIGKWLRHLQHMGEARQALDQSMLGEECEEDDMLMAVRIAVVCLSDLPADRPSSDELVAMLTRLHSF